MSGDHHEHHEPDNFWSKYVFSTDHKVIGMQFTFTALLFVIIGGLLALGVRYQLAWPNQDVPYAEILPGKMTAEAPEANPAHWKLMIGKDAEIAGFEGVEDGYIGSFKGFVNDRLAIELPEGLVVQIGSDAPRTLDRAEEALVDVRSVMGDYDYNAQNAMAAVGTTVTLDGGLQKEAVIKGMEITLPDAAGRGQKVIKTEPVSLPVRKSATLAVITGVDKPIPSDKVTIKKESLTTDAYLQLFTMHASIMIFFVIIPMLVGGFGNFLIPLMVGARDMAFPKLNMLSFWLSFPAGVIMVLSFWVMYGPAGGGWTMYPTLSTPGFLKPEWGTTLWVFSVGLVGFSSVVGALNYITTIINMRAPGMSMFRMPLTVWSLLITSVLAIFATPVLTAAMVMLLFDRLLGTSFFLPADGGQPLLFQHLFWFYSHPAVYIMILPAMGVTSDILAVHARKPIFGYKPMVFAMAAITGLGYIVWGHHMFQSGMNPVLGTTFMATTIMIAVPSAIKTFNWLGTLWGGNIRFNPPMLFALGFVSMFVIGGLSGIFMAAAPVDIHIHDTYFIVAHIHYVLFGGSIMGIFAGVYHWFPKMFGQQMNQKWGVIHFILTIIAFNGTFFLMHVLGVGGHPRRYASIMEYPTLQHLQPMNVIMTQWAIAMGAAQLPFIYNFFASLPRKLGRAMVAFFVVALVAPAVVGFAYWSAIEGAPYTNLPGFSGLMNMIIVGEGAQGFNGFGKFVGHLSLIVVTFGIAIWMFRVMHAGGKSSAIFVVLPVAIYTLLIPILNASGNLSYMELGDGPTLAQQSLAMAHDVFWSPMTAHMMICAGWGLFFAAIATAVVYGIWELGRILKMPTILKYALYVVFLPLFFAPLLLKQDLYIMRGHPDLFNYAWLLVILLAVPGTLYMVIKRPKDEYGFVTDTNPWQANSLEWITQSPPITLNFDEIPTVYRGPYEFGTPVVETDYLLQTEKLPEGVVEPSGH